MVIGHLKLFKKYENKSFITTIKIVNIFQIILVEISKFEQVILMSNKVSIPIFLFSL